MIILTGIFIKYFKKRIKVLNRPYLLIFIILLYISLLSSVIYAGNLDHFIRDQVQRTDKGLIDSSMKIITHLGDAGVNFVIASLIEDKLICKDSQKAILLSGGVALALKFFIGQKRPPGSVEYKPFTFDDQYFSMPSGHTATAFALATILANHDSGQKAVLYSLSSLVGISRLYEDKHWFSNIVLGAFIGYYSARYVLDN